MERLRNYLDHYKFEIFLIALCLNLFGSLVVEDHIFADYVFPASLMFNIIAGINLISVRRIQIIFLALFVLSTCTFGYSMFNPGQIDVDYLRFALYFLFYVVVTYEIIKQILLAQSVSKNVIMGVICGYICLGLVGFFIFLSVEMSHSGSFLGEMMIGNDVERNIDNLLYYSFITLMTIGYGEIVPVTPIAQKSAILIGLLGQFYLVIVTALVVGKYIAMRKGDG